MLIKGLLSSFVIVLCVVSYSPTIMAADSAKKVDEVITWWEKYGKHWDKVKDKKKEEVASSSGK